MQEADVANPYQPPAASIADMDSAEVSQPVSYYRMSTTKLWIMSMLTLNIYALPYFWRHWRTIRAAGEQISPFWRTLFAGFSVFGLGSRLQASAITRDVQLPSAVGAAPTVFFISVAAGWVVDRVAGDDLTALYLVAVLALTAAGSWSMVALQRAANAIVECEPGSPPPNSGVTAGSAIAGLVGAILWLVLIVGALAVEV